MSDYGKDTIIKALFEEGTGITLVKCFFSLAVLRESNTGLPQWVLDGPAGKDGQGHLVLDLSPAYPMNPVVSDDGETIVVDLAFGEGDISRVAMPFAAIAMQLVKYPDPVPPVAEAPKTPKPNPAGLRLV